jgi:F0F1-type ATP synthase epsilon subunit
MEVLPDRVIVLTDTALSKDEVDVEATRAELQRAEEALAQKTAADDSQERRAVAWAHAKLEVAGRAID